MCSEGKHAMCMYRNNVENKKLQGKARQGKFM